jgi:hypothetical protein
MRRLRRWHKIVLVGLAAALLLGAAALGGLYWYLSSQGAVHRIAGRLQDILGAPVHIRQAQVGLAGGSSLQGLEVYEPGGGADHEPWLEINQVSADVSAPGLVRGALPGEVTAEGASLTLRFDRDNHLLTRLPAMGKTALELPRIRMENGRFTLAQEGRPPLAVTGVTAQVTGKGGSLHLYGSIDDPYWGKWTVDAARDPSTRAITLGLDSGPTHVTMDKLRALPFVPATVWQQVQAEGDTPVRCTVTLVPADTPGARPAVHYHIELEPRHTKVHISSINLDADDARGTVIIEDKVVYLRDVKGRTADGEIQTDAVLDFTKPASDLKFSPVGVSDVALHGLPKSWKVPRGIDGRLTGQAELEVTVARGRAIPRGKGAGRIDHPRLGLFRMKRPIPITLVADDRGFHFRQEKGADAAALAGPAAGAVVLVEPPPEKPSGGGLWYWPAEIPTAVGRGVAQLTHRAVDTTWSVVSRVTGPPRPAAKPARAATNYVEADLSLEDVNLAQLLAGIKVHLPFSLSGTLTFKVRVGVPIDTPGELKAYRLQGTATLPRLVVAGVEMTDVRARVRFNEGILDLTELRGRFPPLASGAAAGSFHGSARLEVRPIGKLTLDLGVQDMLLDRALALLPGSTGGANGHATKAPAGSEHMPDALAKGDVASSPRWRFGLVSNSPKGTLSGKVSAHAPADRVRDPTGWEGTATLQSPEVQAYGLRLSDASGRLSVARGRAVLEDFRARLESGPATASGEMDLTSPFRYAARASLTGVDLAALDRLAPDFRLPVHLSGSLGVDAQLSGTLPPAIVNASGSASARDLGIDGLTIDSLKTEWQRNPREWTLRSIRARLYGGEVTGTAVVPVAATAEGRADLRLQGVDAEAFSKAVPAVPVRVEGQVSGTVTGRLAAARPGRPRALSAQIDLKAPRLRVEDIPTERVTARVDYEAGGVAQYTLQGESLGGRFKLQGKLPPRGGAPAEKPAVRPAANRQDEGPPDGHLQVEGVRLQALWQVYHLENTLGPLRGTFSLDLPFRHVGTDRRPEGRGRFQLMDLRWGSEEVSTNVQGDLRLGAEGLEFRDISGNLGQGILRAGFLVPLGRRTGGYFNVALTQVDAGRLLLPWPALAGRVQGSVDLSLRGRLGAEWHGGGTAVLGRGRVFGIEVGEWHLPLQFAFAPRQGTGELSVSDSYATVANGRALGRGEWSFGAGGRVDGHVHFYDVDLRTLVHSAGDVGTVASGRLNGRIDFGGTNVHSVNDLTGTVSAALRQAQALQLPVLRQVTPFLRGGMSSETFQTGQLEARLGRGVVRIKRFNLEGGLVQIVVEGTVNLDGRLSLDVHARTGNVTLLPPGLRLLGLRIPIAGPIPLSVITEASFLLARSVVHLHVTGSVRNPVVQVEPFALLTEEAVRYFLYRALVAAP